jgi:hypothetical protein
MRKFYFFVLALVFAGFANAVYAQEVQKTRKLHSDALRGVVSKENFVINHTSVSGEVTKTVPFRAPGDAVFSANFEGTTGSALPAGWTKSNVGGNQWGTVTALSGLYSRAGSGSRFAAIPYHQSAALNAWLFTPAITLEGGKLYKISFWTVIYGYTGEFDYLEVKIAQTASAAAMGSGDELYYNVSQRITNWALIEVLYTPTVGGDFYLGFHAFTPAGKGLLIAVDDVTVAAPLQKDATVTAISAPVSGRDLTAAETVTATFQNKGLDAITSLDFELTVDGVVVATEPYSGSIASGATANYTFTAKADLSASGSHTVAVKAVLVDDEDASNDSFSVSVDNSQCTGITLPWVEKFTSGIPNCWTLLDEDGDGDKWVATTLDGDGVAVSFSWDDVALTPDNWLITPKIPLGTGENLLSFKVATLEPDYFAEKYSVLVSTTGTATSNFTEIYNYKFESAGTKTVILPLDAYAGEEVYIAFRHWDCTDEYVLVLDSVAVSHTPRVLKDAAVTAISAPVSGRDLTAAETVTATVKNKGYTEITSLNLELTVDGTVVATEPYSGGSIASGATADYTFTAKADLSASGSHTVAVKAVLVDDEDASNDSFSVLVNNLVCAITLPWTETFTEGISECWTLLDADGDGNKWVAVILNEDGDDIAAASFSWYNVVLTPDNWLITPKIPLGAGENSLSFEIGTDDPEFFAEKYSVLVSTTGTAASNFTEIHSYRFESAETKTVTLPLDAYAGQEVYIAFRHWDSTDEFVLILDNVSVVNTPPLSVPVINGNKVNIYQSNDGIFVQVSDNSEIRLLDISGRELSAYAVEANSTLRIEQPSGIYLIEIRSKGGIATHKAVVK